MFPWRCSDDLVFCQSRLSVLRWDVVQKAAGNQKKNQKDFKESATEHCVWGQKNSEMIIKKTSILPKSKIALVLKVGPHFFNFYSCNRQSVRAIFSTPLRILLVTIRICVKWTTA